MAYPSRLIVWPFGACVLLSAFLLFQLEPIIGRMMLPWFGGSPAVWTTAMLFFQLALVGGYAFAHLLARRLPLGAQWGAQMALLVVAGLTLPFTPNERWAPTSSDHPAAQILLLLLMTVGLPFFAISAIGPLAQSWFARASLHRSPYRLYAVSNLGSLVALATYPLLVERWLTLGAQANVWRLLFWIVVALCGLIGWLAVRWQASKPATAIAPSEAQAAPRPTLRRVTLWCALSAFASATYLAATNHICQDVAVAPLFWVLPLGLYLLTLIVAFDRERWYRGRVFAGAAALFCPAVAIYDMTAGNAVDQPHGNFFIAAGLSLAAMTAICMLCHGELARLKPAAERLTTFYLAIAAGGAMGGVLVAVLAPLIFRSFLEWPIALAGGVLLALAVLLGTGPGGQFARAPLRFVPAMGILAGAGAFGAAWSSHNQSAVIETDRSFFGVSIVAQSAEPTPTGLWLVRILVNGRIRHGAQFLDDSRRQIPTAYYDRASGVGRVLEYLGQRPQISVGAIGLGVGTLAAYARANDRYEFFEIDPIVQSLCERRFTFLLDARQRMESGDGRLDVTMGDGRLSLDREFSARALGKGPSNGSSLFQSDKGQDTGGPFDLLVVDAFSGDAIPTHLLTREAADVYRRALTEKGVLALHISNAHLDLTSVVRGMADYLQLDAVKMTSAADHEQGTLEADWMILTADKQLLAALKAHGATTPDRPATLWTDDFSNLLGILR